MFYKSSYHRVNYRKWFSTVFYLWGFLFYFRESHDNLLILSLSPIHKIEMFKEFLFKNMMVITLVFCNALIKVHDKAFIQQTNPLLALILKLKVSESESRDHVLYFQCMCNYWVKCLCIMLHHSNLILIFTVCLSKFVAGGESSSC